MKNLTKKMKNLQIPFYLFFLISSLCTTPLRAQLDSTDIFSLSLEDLLNVKVITASKSAESQSSAPAVMTIITDREIEAYGDMSMGDILDRVVNVYVTGSYLIQSNNVNIRGEHTGLYDTHVLWLLNGRPMRESVQAGVNTAILNMFPVESIKRVEMIRGPGSVLYGTSAFQGVINIITKDAEKPLEMYASTQQGSFNTSQNEISMRAKVGEDLKINVGFMNHSDDGWVTTQVFENGDRITTNMYEVGHGTFLNASYKKFTLNGFYGYDRMRQWGRSMSSFKDNLSYENKRGTLDAGYALDISDKFSSNINLGYNFANHNYIFDHRHADRGDWRYSHDFLAEISNNLKVNDNMNIVFGGTGMYLSGEALRPELTTDKASFPIDSIENPDPYVNIPQYGEVWFNGYLQADYTWKIFKLVVGGQANKVKGVDWNFVPRLGLITNVNENIYGKILYSSAFRVGSFFERGATSLPSVLGNPELDPETITTFEAQLGYQKSDLNIVATFYASEENDLIGRSLASDSLAVVDYQGSMVSVPLYINKGSASFKGVELEAKKYFTKNFGVNGSFSYQTSEDDEGSKDFFGLPQVMVKAGVHYRSDKGFNFGIFNSYFGEGGSITTYDDNGDAITQEVNEKVAAFNYLTANASVDLFKLMGKEYDSKLYFNLNVVNLLDADIHYPEVQRRKVNSIPGRPGRAIYAGMKFKF